MEFLELARQRKSIRTYLNKPLERSKISQCLEAARLAPSACNAQPWRFMVIDNPELRNHFCEKVFSGIYSMNQFVKKAPVIIAVVSDKETFIRKLGAFIKGTDYYLIDLGIACQHFILQATELGLGTCWIGWFNERAAKKLLRVPCRRRIDILISVGYFDPAAAKERPRKSLEEMSCYFS